MSPAIRILYVDDSAHDRELVRDVLEKEAVGFIVTEAVSRSDFEAKIAESEYDVILSDFNIQGFEGLQVLEAAHAKNPYLPVIFITETGSEKGTVEMLKRGAADYLIQSTALIQLLPQTIYHAIAISRVEKEHRETLEALHESDAKYRRLVENVNDVIFELDGTGLVIYISPVIQTILEYRPKDIIGRNFLNFIYSEDKELLILRFEQILKDESEPTEYRLVTKSGEAVWVQSSSKPILKNGNVVGASGVLIDINKRKQAELQREAALAALEEERNLFQILMNNIPDQIYFKDIESRFIRINQAQARHLGLTDPLQALGKTDYDFFVEQHARAAYEDEQEIIRSGHPLIGKEEKEVWPDLHTAWASTTKMPLRDSEGQVIGTFGISRNITQHKLAEESLRESEERFKSFFENAGDAILIITPDGRIIAANPAACKIFMRTEQEITGGGRGLVINTADSRFIPALKQRLEKDNNRVELTFIKKDGNKFEGELTSVGYNDKNGTQMTVMIVRDITERKQAEISLQKRLEELETVNRLSILLRAGETVQQLLQILLDETLKTIEAADGCVLIFDPSSQKLEVPVSKGWFDKLAGVTLDSDEGINRKFGTTNQPYISREIKGDQTVSKNIRDLAPTQWSGGFFPIQCDEGTIGVLIVSVPSPRLFLENEQRLFTIISQLASNAILRSRLHEKLRLSNIDLQKEVEQRNIFQAMLAEEKELLSITLMSIDEGVIITDRDSLVVLYNRSAEKITGYELLEVIDRPLDTVFQIIDTNTQQPVSDLINKLPELTWSLDNDPNYRAPSLITRSGTRILVSGSISALKSSNGEIMGHVIVFQDITEKQKAEAQLLLSQKMRAIGQLAAGIAHEINTPIQYIGDNLRFLQKTCLRFTEILDAYQTMILEPDKPLGQEDKDQIKEIFKQKKIQHYINESPKAIQDALDGVERVRKIVLAMREFSHPSDKQKMFADINHGIETTIVISRNEWKYCAELETNLDPELPMVECQIDEINQVILNMIVNAAQSIQEKIPAGSEEKGEIHISTIKDEKMISIIIRDNGQGISDETRLRVFDPFFTTKGVGKGTGQGLSMAHNIIVNEHHGKIKIDSILGQGTTFTIELPINLTKEGS